MPHLTEDERYFIACELSSKKKKNWIAEQLGRDPSTISREIKRNRCPDGIYRWYAAHRRAKERKQYRTVIGKLLPGKARREINYSLLRNWSPEQISNHLRRTNSWLQVSHQTIYKYVWSFPRAAPQGIASSRPPATQKAGLHHSRT